MAVFKNILVPLDGSPLAEGVLPHLLGLADADTRVALVHVLGIGGETSQEMPVDPLEWRFVHSEAQAYLERLANRLRDTNLREVEYEVLEGDAADRVLEYSRRLDSDLILLSSHGRSGFTRWNISSVVRKIIQRAHRSTMIVRAYNFQQGKKEPAILNLAELTPYTYRHILVPLDGSLRAELSLQAAINLAQQHQAWLTLAHVIGRPELIQRIPPTPEDQQLLNRLTERVRETAGKYFDQLRSQIPVDFSCELRVSSDISGALQNMIDKLGVDMVFMSAHGHSADRGRYYGSIASGVIDYGSTSLVLIQDFDLEDLQPSRAEEAAREQKGHA